MLWSIMNCNGLVIALNPNTSPSARRKVSMKQHNERIVWSFVISSATGIGAFPSTGCFITLHIDTLLF